MSQEKKYWKSEVELKPNDGLDKIRHDEFVEKLPIEENIFSNDSVKNADTNRRDFLKYLGFSTTAAVLASCEGPVHKSVPYVVQPDRIIPGIANYYATTLFDGFDSANVLVKTREGRPIWIKGLKDGYTKGGMTARIGASILNLYNGTRLNGPTIDSQESTWDSVDTQIKEKLTAISNDGGNIRILSNSIISPSTIKVIDNFKQAFGEKVKHVQ